MSIEAEAEKDLTLESKDAEQVDGGRRKSKQGSTQATAKTAARGPLVVTVAATTPPVPGPPDPGADNSGPEADNC